MKKIISILLVTVFAAVVMMSGAYASGASVAVVVTGEATVGSTITVRYDLAGNPGFASGMITLNYDNTALELVSLTKGLFQGDANATTGIVNHASSDAVTGDGTLCTATFKVLKSGTSSVGAVVSGMRDNDGNPFDVAVTPASVEAAESTVHVHSYDEGVVTTSATCSSKGVKTFTCDCGDSYTQEIEIDSNAHNWDDGTVNTAGSCVAKSVKTFTCTLCGTTKSEEDAIVPDAHVWGEWIETTAATCTEKGVESRSCINGCGVEPETRELDPLGHGQWIDYKVVTEATCGADGVAQGECGLCHNVFDDIVIPATGEHSWDEGEVSREATTEAEGEKTFTCTVCGATRTEAIAKLAPVATAKPAAKPHSPKTGDESHLVVWAALLLLLACGGTVVVIAQKSKTE